MSASCIKTILSEGSEVTGHLQDGVQDGHQVLHEKFRSDGRGGAQLNNFLQQSSPRKVLFLDGRKVNSTVAKVNIESYYMPNPQFPFCSKLFWVQESKKNCLPSQAVRE